MTEFPNETQRTEAWLNGYRAAVSKLAQFGVKWEKPIPGLTEAALRKACEPKASVAPVVPVNGGDGAPRPAVATASAYVGVVAKPSEDDVISIASDDSTNSLFRHTVDEGSAVGALLSPVGVVRTFNAADFDPETPGARELSLDDVGTAISSLDHDSRENAIGLVAETCGYRRIPMDSAVPAPASAPAVPVKSKPLYIKVPVAGTTDKFDEMYVGTLVALWNTDPTASSDRIKRIREAAAGFLSDKDLICNDASIAVNVDCAWNFDEGLEFGRVLLIGTKKGANSVVPIRTPVSLKDDVDPNVVVACHYYVPLESDEDAKIRAELGDKVTPGDRLFRFGPGRWSSVTCT